VARNQWNRRVFLFHDLRTEYSPDHGLLTAATKPPVGRLVLLSKLEETLLIDGRRYELSSNQYPGVIHPQGFHYQIAFQLNPFPTVCIRYSKT
jgi:predicted glycogen debranching enzyme